MKQIIFASFLSFFLQSGMLLAQECITWFEGPGAQPLGQPHQGCAPCGEPVTYVLHSIGDCNSQCTNLFTMEQMGTLVIDNAASYTILGSKTISITWLCNEDPSGVIYACGSDNATAINLCEQPCTGGFQYCLRVSCDTLCVTLRGQQTTFVVSSSNSTPKFFCFDYPIATVSQYPCGAGGGIGYQMQDTDLVPNETVNFAVPNPATDLVKINVPVNMIGKNMIQVLGIDGKTIYSRNFEGSEFDINTSQWPAGVYQVKLRNNESEVQQKLLIVR